MMKYNKSDVIAFYTTKEEFGCFSNFYRAPLIIGAKVWPTSEHYYQAQKFTDPTIQEQIRNAASPKEAAHLGRTIKTSFRSDWEEVKFEVMLTAVRAKFNQNARLRNILLSTGDKDIVEWTEGTPLADPVWGNAPDKDGNPGQNLLGKALMIVRQEMFHQLNKAELDI
jgi:N-glycosidase YbiA